MTSLDRLTRRLADRPAIGLRLRLVLPYAMAAYIVYILLWYLPFKFAPDSFLFSVIAKWVGIPGFEPYFRYFTGGVEVVACLLLVIPGLQVAGAAVALATMTGAIFFHLFTPLGIDPYHDGGTLFKEACTNWVFALGILVIRRRDSSSSPSARHGPPARGGGERGGFRRTGGACRPGLALTGPPIPPRACPRLGPAPRLGPRGF